MSDVRNLAGEVADRLRGRPAPWDVFAERSRRYEIHLTGSRVELTRGPMVLEGYGVRVLRGLDGQTGVGFRASTDLSPEGIRIAADDAEKHAPYNRFPAERVQLPVGSPPSGARGEILDPALWSDPGGTLDRFAAALLAAFDGRTGTMPSFSSMRATLTESSIANSSGLTYAYAHTVTDTEIAVKSFGGPEGRPPGEYWLTGFGRRLLPDELPDQVADWSRYAADARRGKTPPNGTLPVVFPPEVLAEIVPAVVGFQFSAAARLRGMAVTAGAQVAAEGFDIFDDGTFDWGAGSSPVDDEGTAPTKRPLVSSGKATGLLYDVLHAAALGATSSGNGSRSSGSGPGRSSWRRFARRPGPSASTLVIPAGTGGHDAEVIEQVDDGLWIQQIGWAQPDGISGRFGGEIRIGYRIRHGKLAEPVRGGTVGGAVLSREGTASLLRDVSVAGSRAKLCGDLSSPTLVIRSLSVSGDNLAGSTDSR